MDEQIYNITIGHLRAELATAIAHGMAASDRLDSKDHTMRQVKRLVEETVRLVEADHGPQKEDLIKDRLKQILRILNGTLLVTDML